MASYHDASDADHDEDDYMTMGVADLSQVVPTWKSVQRQKIQADINAHKSAAERRADATAKFTSGLETSILDSNSKGRKMMQKMGWAGGNLGVKAAQADEDVKMAEPIAINIIKARAGLGSEPHGQKRAYSGTVDDQDKAEKKHKPDEQCMSEQKRKVNEQDKSEKRHKAELDEWRVRNVNKAHDKKLKETLWSAMKTARSLQEDADGMNYTGPDETPQEANDVNVLWRELAHERVVAAAIRRNKRAIKDKPRATDDEFMVEYYREVQLTPHEIEACIQVHAHHDQEYNAHMQLPVSERLERLLLFMRATFKYCFYCKDRVDDTSLNSTCPGLTAADHGEEC